jgi:hypothetical protein
MVLPFVHVGHIEHLISDVRLFFVLLIELALWPIVLFVVLCASSGLLCRCLPVSIVHTRAVASCCQAPWSTYAGITLCNLAAG